MKRTIIALMLLPFLFLSGCSRSEATNEDFTLTLYGGKGVYKNGGQLECYATIHYTGGNDRVTVYGGDPVVVFSLKNSAGHIIGGLEALGLGPTVFTHNETKKYPFVKTGAFSEDTPQWVKDYLTNDGLTLPKGTYTIIAEFEYTLDSYPTGNSFITLEATKTIKIK